MELQVLNNQTFDAVISAKGAALPLIHISEPTRH